MQLEISRQQTNFIYVFMRITQFFTLNINLNTSAMLRNAEMLMPVLFGAWSVLLGTDTNWDLYNYHLYNAFAFLHNKLSIDFAPGGFQNFFNPMLDIPYFLALTHFPPRLVGFLMGVLHGLNFIILLNICRYILPNLPERDLYRLPLFLAIAGCLTGNFLSELGNTMGDDSTSIFSLGAVLVILYIWRSRSPTNTNTLVALIFSGILMGIACGLKLTNAIYAVAIFVGLLMIQISSQSRIKTAVIFGVNVLLGLSLSAGPWYYTMWHAFGNPLFPQFGSIFPNPLASTVSIADTSWIPKELWKKLLWPFLISDDSSRVGQVPVRQIIWAIFYILLVTNFAKQLFNRWMGIKATKYDPSAKFIIIFVVLGFILWMLLFGIGRYLVTIELLTPLVIFLTLNQITSYDTARKIFVWIISFAILVELTGGIGNWGHQPWSQRPFYVDVPPLSQPEKTTVLITEGDIPLSWLAVSFPVKVAFVQIAGSFPQGSEFKPYIKEILKNRGGPVYAAFAAYDLPARVSQQNSGARVKEIAESLGLTRTVTGCNTLRYIGSKSTRFIVDVKPLVDLTHDKVCDFDVSYKSDLPSIASEIQTRMEKSMEALNDFGFSMDAKSCSLHSAGIGDSEQVFQWCAIFPHS